MYIHHSLLYIVHSLLYIVHSLLYIVHSLGPVFLEANPKAGRHNLLLAHPLLPCTQSHVQFLPSCHALSHTYTPSAHCKLSVSAHTQISHYVAHLFNCSTQASVQASRINQSARTTIQRIIPKAPVLEMFVLRRLLDLV